MRNALIQIALLSVLLVPGCGANLAGLAKKQACVVGPDGKYTGEPKEKAVKAVAKVIREAAKRVGYEIDETAAYKYAREALKKFCSADDKSVLPLAVYTVLKPDMPDADAFNVAVECAK